MLQTLQGRGAIFDQLLLQVGFIGSLDADAIHIQLTLHEDTLICPSATCNFISNTHSLKLHF